MHTGTTLANSLTGLVGCSLAHTHSRVVTTATLLGMTATGYAPPVVTRLHPNLLYAGGPTNTGVRYTPIGGPAALYLGSSERVANAEWSSALRELFPGMPLPPRTVFQVNVILKRVLDLSVEANQICLGTNGDQVVFRQPRIKDYEGFTGYFAHGRRKAGDISHYGESLMVMLQSLAENNGEFAINHYQRIFKLHFGPGGPFVGYIDNATRITLQNLTRIESEAVEAALRAAPPLPDETRNKLIGQVLTYCRIYSGQALRAPVERDIRMTGGDDQMVE
jgi:hypothetical protein